MKMNLSRTVAHKGQCNKNGLLQTKKDRMQTKKTGCKQKTKTCHDVNKKDRMQKKRIWKLKRKWNNVERARADTRLSIFGVNEAN